ncbi:DNA alkylation repair protein [Flavihumibacter profundi]|uniref:DNA alkylation repair protein n=1 Tax=Flavihumibacter profundi TaxID=2716883 RepID=UPI001CC3AB14|nr:DNA alkylation repair protein [Flavihumibacter profundi]MBZ5855861.1 DNA alkylation repair protein [Flavihumibacter profundi]
MQKKTKQLLEELLPAMEFHRDPALALPMARYMKNLFPYLGIKQPLRKTLSARFMKEAKDLDNAEIIALADALWNKPEREFQYIAMELLYAARKKWDNKSLPFFCSLVNRKPWWDTVDFIASKLIGTYYAGKHKPPKMIAWSATNDLWQNRTAILFQLNYKKATDSGLLFAIINRVKHKKDFFIQKAIGWSLRQYHRTDPAAVELFVEQAAINGLAKREALKHA